MNTFLAIKAKNYQMIHTISSGTLSAMERFDRTCKTLTDYKSSKKFKTRKKPYNSGITRIFYLPYS